MKAIILAILSCLPALAWHDSGHMAVAYIAYRNLTPQARGAVDQMLRAHPDYAVWTLNVPAEKRGLTAFLLASVWADDIKNDPRFQEDPREGNPEAPAPNALGLPNLYRHRRWHYTNGLLTGDYASLRVDEAGTAKIRPTHALTQIALSRAAIQDGQLPMSQRAYYLAWLLHLAGDIHQPLHCTDHNGDQGGNRVQLKHAYGNLHSYWDSLGGGALSLLQLSIAEADKQILDERRWFREGIEVAIQVVYKGLAGANQTDGKIELPEAYHAAARAAARPRAALAGYRIANLLNAARW